MCEGTVPVLNCVLCFRCGPVPGGDFVIPDNSGSHQNNAQDFSDADILKYKGVKKDSGSKLSYKEQDGGFHDLQLIKCDHGNDKSHNAERAAKIQPPGRLCKGVKINA